MHVRSCLPVKIVQPPSRFKLSVCCAAGRVGEPPAGYRLRDGAYVKSSEIVNRDYPVLRDLVENGSLIVHERSCWDEERQMDDCEGPERIFLVGTCHMSLKSAADVKRVIVDVRPENVVVELCRSRASILYDAHKAATEKNVSPPLRPMHDFVNGIKRTVGSGGVPVLIFRSLLRSASQRISSSFEAKGGEEMRAAKEAADRIGAHVILGDRPIEITLERAIESLPVIRRLTLLGALFCGLLLAPSMVASEAAEMRRAVDKVDEDMVSSWVALVTDQFPELAAPLIHERDVYLARSMKDCEEVQKTTNVVGVVGRVHLKGVYYALENGTGDTASVNSTQQESN